MKDAMEYKGYYGSVHLDEEAFLLYGKVLFIKALVTYEAEDAKGLRKAFEESVDDYLETCRQQAIKPEVPFKGSLNIRLDSELHRRIALAAEHRHVSINKFIYQTLQRVVE